MTKPLVQNQVYYEIAMSIGNTLNLRKMLRESLCVYLRKLNCSAGLILMQTEHSKDIYHYEAFFSIPRNIKQNPVIQAAIQRIPKSLNPFELQQFLKSTPIEGNLEGSYFYIMDLSDFGLFILVNNHVPFDFSVIQSLKPLNKKLAKSCIACLQNEKVQMVNEHLKKEIAVREQAEEELKRAHSLLKTVINSTPDLIFYKTKEGIYQGCNHAFTLFVGLPEDKIMGRSDMELFSKEAAKFFQKMDRQMLLEKVPRLNEEWVDFADGRKVLLDTLKSPYYGPNNEMLGLIAVSRDITENRKSEEERVRLIAEKEIAEASNRTKSEFLANMSHELRTPLNHIIGFSEIVLDQHFGSLNDIQKEYIGDVHQSSKHLLALINDILDFSKIEAGKMELMPAQTDIRLLLENSLNIIKEKTLKHNIQLTREINFHLKFITADERKLKQVLYNLLSNAAKFTPEGGRIHLSLDIVSRNNIPVHDQKEFTAENFVKISVKDTGIGIHRKDLNRIFNPFDQVESSYSKKYHGTGLGLALSKELVELHGGEIWAESPGENKGSCFNFVLPLH